MNGKGRRRVGVLALQGNVREHLRALEECGVEALPVKRPETLRDLDGLVIPGGESTAIGMLADEYGFFPAIREAVAGGLALFGTCAGLILMADRVAGSTQPRLGLLPITVRRNGFGRQRESFELDLEIPVLGPEPLRAVFIRAPYIEAVGPGVEPLASVDGKVVAARSGRHLVAAFHPELTPDRRLHRYFVDDLIGGGGT